MWYCIEIIYDDPDNGTCRMTKKNFDGKQLQAFRESLYAAGLFVPSEEHPKTEGAIISPFAIRKVNVWMQKTKFE
jgi:hypothetical protein